MLSILYMHILLFSGSPIGSVQDISPPSTPSNSGVSSLSPYVNSSTANSITSPHVFTSSPGVSSVVQSSHSTSTSYPNYYRYPGSDSKSVTGGSSLSSSQNSTYTGYPTPQNNSDVSAVKSPTPALHPLQQAMLLQQQQQQQMVVSIFNYQPFCTRLCCLTYRQTFVIRMKESLTKNADWGDPFQFSL